LNAVSESSNNCSGISHYAATILPANDNNNAALLAVKETRAVFGLLLHFFNANVVGTKESAFTLTEPRPGLPDDLYTTASFASSVYQATASKKSWWLFVSLEGLILALCVSAIAWARQNIAIWPVRTGEH
jgi:hypothetical protein